MTYRPLFYDDSDEAQAAGPTTSAINLPPGLSFYPPGSGSNVPPAARYTVEVQNAASASDQGAGAGTDAGNGTCVSCSSRGLNGCDLSLAPEDEYARGCTACRKLDIDCYYGAGSQARKLIPREDGNLPPLACDACMAPPGDIHSCSWRSVVLEGGSTRPCTKCVRENLPCSYLGVPQERLQAEHTHFSRTQQMNGLRLPNEFEFVTNAKATFQAPRHGNRTRSRSPGRNPLGNNPANVGSGALSSNLNLDPSLNSLSSLRPSALSPALPPAAPPPTNVFGPSGTSARPSDYHFEHMLSRTKPVCSTCSSWFNNSRVFRRCNHQFAYGCTFCREVGLVCVVEGEALPPHPSVQTKKAYYSKCDYCKETKSNCDRQSPCDVCYERGHPELCTGETKGRMRRGVPGSDMYVYYSTFGYGPGGVNDANVARVPLAQQPEDYHLQYLQKIAAEAANPPQPPVPAPAQAPGAQSQSSLRAASTPVSLVTSDPTSILPSNPPSNPFSIPSAPGSLEPIPIPAFVAPIVDLLNPGEFFFSEADMALVQDYRNIWDTARGLTSSGSAINFAAIRNGLRSDLFERRPVLQSILATEIRNQLQNQLEAQTQTQVPDEPQPQEEEDSLFVDIE
ncbi:hypothetical protein F5Y19DRAFT_475319 [Xylariaceae sp. FL1651]|nr:hypothetical protein F5Y19DRAFT_475319 [Xylariaceae sp. FL1651]